MDQINLIQPDKMVNFKQVWTPPSTFPDLSGAKRIAIDLETCDPDLKTHGPGTRRGSYIVGVAVGTDDGFRGYYPVAHVLGGNFNKEVVYKWLNKELSRVGQPKIGANLLYDLEFLEVAGVYVEGPFYDVQVAAPLINENHRSYSLDAIAQRVLGESKVTNDLYLWLALAHGGTPTAKDQGGRIHLAPTWIVGPYAEGDVDLPLRIFKEQEKVLNANELDKIFLLESRLIPMLLDMRIGGVRVDLDKVEKARDASVKSFNEYIKMMELELGFGIDIWSANSLEKAFKKKQIEYPYTPTGKPSFTKPFLEAHSDPFVTMVLDARKLDKLRSTFLEGTILSKHINGRIYTQFNQLKSDDTGTITGRFSSTNPNLQFIPIRDRILGPLVRGMFIPEDGDEWVKDDYSQIEYRIITHYATGKSAEKAREEYRNDPRTDYHSMVAEMCNIARTPAKTINFGLAYGMGVDKLALSLRLDKDTARILINEYHDKVPFLKELMSACMDVAAQRGYIKTILGRRLHFDLWENRYTSETITNDEYDKLEISARRGYRRTKLHKALNKLIQGSAADVLKSAMVDLWESGVCKVIRPLLTVHDELDWSKPKTPEAEEAHKVAVRIMEQTVKFSIPIIVDTESGPDWGHVK
jgi:DNA polymerase I-like protein with 3'-5' exonuclease and polymerase domains